MAAISVDAPAMAAHGHSLADAQDGQTCGACQPAAPDSVSTAVAESFTAWASGLEILVRHAAAQRATGGAAVSATGQELAQADAEAGSVIASYGQAQMSSGISGMPSGHDVMPAAAAAPPVPAALAPMPAEVWSQVIHGGPGSAPLRALAQQLQGRATILAQVSGNTEQIGRAVDASWNEGDQPAGRKIVRHARWLSDAADYARGLARSAESAASTVDRAQSSTPTPETFETLRAEYRQALATYVDSGGTVSQPLSTVSANIAQAQSEALSAQSVYAAAAQVDTTTVPAPPSPPPPIIGPSDNGMRQGSTGAEEAQKKTETETETETDSDIAKGPSEDEATDGDRAALADSGEPSSPQEQVDDSGVDGGGHLADTTTPPDHAPLATDAAANSAGELIGTMLGTATQSAGGATGLLPSGGAGSPMSALSGLSSMPSMGGFPSPSGSPQDLGLGDDLGMPENLFDETTPASAGGGIGGGGGGGGGLPAGTPVSAPAAAAIPPGASTGSPAAAAPAATGGARMGGMGGMIPPMMGAGNGADKERDKDLHPDRRVVHREIANTEAVFGELEQLRKRSGRRRSSRTQEESSADDTSNESG